MKKIFTLILFAVVLSFAQTTATYRSVATCMGGSCYPATDNVHGYTSLVTSGTTGIMSVTIGNTSNVITFTNSRIAYNNGIEIIISDMIDNSGMSGTFYSTPKGLMFFDGVNTLMLYDGDPSELYSYFNYITH